MVSQKEMRAANASLPRKPLTAVFVGATSGIGLGTIEALLKNTTSSRLFIIGRSESKFAPTLTRLKTLDPSANITFLEAQVSLLNEISRVCDIISGQTSSIDLLWLSQGGLSCAGHIFTSEKLFEDFAVAYYGRLFFIHKLLPALNRSSRNARVVSILSAGQEGLVKSDDFGIQNLETFNALGFWGALKQGVTMMSLALHELAIQNPKVSFIHTNPGFVGSDVHQKWANTMTGWLTPVGWLLSWVVIPLTHLMATTPEAAGEVGFFEATSERFRSDNGQNFFRLNESAEEVGSEGKAVLEGYESDGTRVKAWEHTLGVFKKVVGK